VQKLRIRYAKRGRLRFSSHRDFSRALERAVRRAALPMAYSAGFSPHPKISYVGAAPTGVASEAEYLEIGLAERRDPADVLAALDASLPPGLDILECVEGSGGSLPERITGSHWLIELPGADPVVLAAAVATFLAAESVDVERMTKDGRRRFDARGAVAALQVSDTTPEETGGGVNCGILHVVVRHLTPAVRPDDVLSGLRAAAGFEVPTGARVTRLAQGLLGEDGTIGDPLSADRQPVDHPAG
jgi:radical SAM-linked protein